MLLPTLALASDPLLGIWRTEPDRKDLTAHILVHACGQRICGDVQEAFDSAGNSVVTQNVGRRLFWDLVPKGDGTYDEGTVFVPLMNVTARAKVQIIGPDRIRVIGCKAMVCDGQVWTRVQ